ncbi:MAG: hypothetical protein AB4042_01010 [Leptolyngbyaceae cyanobacterium]
MPNPTIAKVVEEMSDLPDALQQKVLQFVEALRQQHLETTGDAWDILEALTGTVEAPPDWSDS